MWKYSYKKISGSQLYAYVFFIPWHISKFYNTYFASLSWYWALVLNTHMHTCMVLCLLLFKKTYFRIRCSFPRSLPTVLLQVVHFHFCSLTNLIKCAVFKLRKAQLSLVDICLGMLSLMLLLVFHKSSSGKETNLHTSCRTLIFYTLTSCKQLLVWPQQQIWHCFIR